MIHKYYHSHVQNYTFWCYEANHATGNTHLPKNTQITEKADGEGSQHHQLVRTASLNQHKQKQTYEEGRVWESLCYNIIGKCTLRNTPDARFFPDMYDRILCLYMREKKADS